MTTQFEPSKTASCSTDRRNPKKGASKEVAENLIDKKSGLISPMALMALGLATGAAEASVEHPEHQQSQTATEQTDRVVAAESVVEADVVDMKVEVEVPGAVITAAEELAKIAKPVVLDLEQIDGLAVGQGQVTEPEVIQAETAEAVESAVGQWAAIPDGESLLSAENSAFLVAAADAPVSDAGSAGVSSASGSAAPGAAASTGTATATAAAGGLTAGQIFAAVVGVAAAGGAGASSGGGGGGSGSSSVVTTALTGSVADGYLKDATLYVDMDDDGKLSAGDVQVRNTKETDGLTSDDGSFSVNLTADQLKHGLLSIGGTDITTGKAYAGTYVAPAVASGQTSLVINPLTTVIHAMAQQSVGAGATESEKQQAIQAAETTLKEALGIRADIDLKTLDAVKGTVSTDGTAQSGVTQAEAIEVQAKALMVANLLVTGTAVITGAAKAVDSTASETTTLTSFVVQGLVDAINTASATGTAVNLASSDLLKDVLNTAVTGVQNSTDSSVAKLASLDDSVATQAVEAASKALAAGNTVINTVAGNAAASAASSDNATDSLITQALTQMIQAQAVVQTTVGDKLSSGDTANITTVATGYASTTDVFNAAKTVTSGIKVTDTVVANTTVVTDSTAPTITGITGPSAGTFNAGDVLVFKVALSEGVMVTGTPLLGITVGGVASQATYDPALSSGNLLAFTYKVTAGDLGTIAIPTVNSSSLTDGTIKDLSDYVLTRTFDTTSVNTAWTIDNTAPTVTIALVGGASLPDTGTIGVTFTLSEAAASGTFTQSDISVTGGTLSAFTGSGTSYTATFTPTSGAATRSLQVKAGVLEDAAGNTNTLSNLISSVADNTAPTLTITSNDEALKAGETATITFDLSEDAAGTFTKDDITVTGGTLGALTQSATDSTIFTAKFTPTADSITTATISVAAGKFTDAAGNTNTAATTSLLVDTLAPTVAVSTSKAQVAKLATGATAAEANQSTITFTLSEASTDFTAADVTVSGGTLSGFSGSGTSYTATFTPTAGATSATVRVAGGKFVDASGNSNLASGTAKIEMVDTPKPTVVISTDDNALNVGDTATVTFVVSETVAAGTFTKEDVTVTGGTLGTLATSDNKTFTATFTPTSGYEGQASISVAANKFQSDASIPQDNLASKTLSLDVDTTAPSTPFIVGLTNAERFVNAADKAAGLVVSGTAEGASQVTVTIDNQSVTADVLNGKWSATVPTAKIPTDGNHTVTVSAIDGAGNAAAMPASFTAKIDTVRPTVISVADDVSGTVVVGTNSVAYTYTFSEAVTGLTSDDFTISNGTVSSVTGSGTSWTVNVTPAADTASGNISLTLKAGAVTDAAGNTNVVDSSRADQAIDTLRPSVSSVTDDVTGTANASTGNVAYTYTFSEAVTGLSEDDFTISNGTVSSVSGSGTTWTVNVTPDSGVASGNISLTLKAGTVTDAAGNTNLVDTARAAQAIDTVRPTVTSVTDNVSGTVNAATTSIAYTYTFSEAVTGLTADDFTIANGTVSSVTGSGTTWTVNVTPAASTASGNISLMLKADTVTDAAGNANMVDSDRADQAIDTVAPTTKVTGVALSADNGISGTDFITNTGSQTITATLSAGLVTGEKLMGSLNNGTDWSDLTGLVSGTTLTLSNVTLTGINTMMLKVVDAAGNEGETVSQDYEIDTVAPDKPVITAVTDNSGSTSDRITNDTTPTLTVTAEAGGRVYLGQNGTALGSGWTAAETQTPGTYTVTVTGALSDGGYGVRVMDAAGNLSAVSSAGETSTFRIDSTPPDAPVLTLGTGVSGGATSAEATQGTGVVTVTGESGAAISVVFTNGSNTVTKTLTGNGSAQAVVLTSGDLTTLTDGTVTVTATVTDAAGNATNSSGSTTFALDTVAPAGVVPFITPDEDFVFNEMEDTATLQYSANGTSGWADFETTFASTPVDLATAYFRQVDAAGNTGPVGSSAYTLFEDGAMDATNATTKDFSAKSNTVIAAMYGGDDVVKGGSGNDYLMAGDGADTVTGGAGADQIWLGNDSSIDIVKLLAATDSSGSNVDTVYNFGSNDKVDLSAILGSTGIGYTSASMMDTGAGFVELENLQLVKNTGTGKTTVTFDVTFDAATYAGSKISGALIDLVYDYSVVSNGAITSPTFSTELGSANVWKASEANLKSTTTTANGKIALLAEPDSVSEGVINPIIVDSATGKVLGVTLVVNALVDTFSIGIESKADGGSTEITTVNSVVHDVDVGIAKTAGAPVGSAGVLIYAQDTGSLGTVGDNELHFYSAYDSDTQMTTFKAQYDTNSAVGTTTLSDIIELHFVGDVTSSLTPDNLTFI